MENVQLLHDAANSDFTMGRITENSLTRKWFGKVSKIVQVEASFEVIPLWWVFSEWPHRNSAFRYFWMNNWLMQVNLPFAVWDGGVVDQMCLYLQSLFLNVQFTTFSLFFLLFKQ